MSKIIDGFQDTNVTIEYWTTKDNKRRKIPKFPDPNYADDVPKVGGIYGSLVIHAVKENDKSIPTRIRQTAAPTFAPSIEDQYEIFVEYGSYWLEHNCWIIRASKINNKKSMNFFKKILGRLLAPTYSPCQADVNVEIGP